jgi:hypothetical protein
MNSLKVVGRRKPPQTPEEFHGMGSRLDREIDALRPAPRPRGFVFKARTWEDFARWQASRDSTRHG